MRHKKIMPSKFSVKNWGMTLLFFMAILEAKKKLKYKTFFYIFWKAWTTNTLSLNSWVGEAYINIRLENGYILKEKHD